ncbi:putative ankyrin repeat protein RF_0381 [Patella vulgata]|uniref:putative ankyrin repeat protein RF_0381 n=1 Tax=Patella vulgata TaxID=6465 RepID=UPI00217F5B00|nr:putative ankyrin repeat protein RF_0381 [Patella vulgata]
MAAPRGMTDVVEYLIDNGADVNLLDSFQNTALHYLAANLNPHTDKAYLVQKFVDSGIDFDIQNGKGKTPLFIAVRHANEDVVRVLIRNKCNVNLRGGKTKEPPLKASIYRYVKGRKSLSTMLLTAGCDVNSSDADGVTPLMIATRYRNTDLIKMLIQKGADVNARDKRGRTVCHYCFHAGVVRNPSSRRIYTLDPSLNILEYFKTLGIDALKENKNNALLCNVLSCSDFTSLDYLLGKNITFNELNESGENILHHLVRARDFKMDYDLEKLIVEGVDINQRNKNGDTPFMVAAFMMNIKCMEAMSKIKGSELGLTNNRGHNALHLCIIGFSCSEMNLITSGLSVSDNHKLYLSCVCFLLGRGVRVNERDRHGRTPLMLAASSNDSRLVKTLLDVGADVTLLDNLGKSAIQYITIKENESHDVKCFLYLFNAGFKFLNIPDYGGNTILQSALRTLRHKTACRALVDFLISENCHLYKRFCFDPSGFLQNRTADFVNCRKALLCTMYQSGMSLNIIKWASDDMTKHSHALPDRPNAQVQDDFPSFRLKMTLQSECRRIIRQALGLGIKKTVTTLGLPTTLQSFILMKDVLPTKYFTNDVWSMDLITEKCFHEKYYASHIRVYYSQQKQDDTTHYRMMYHKNTCSLNDESDAESSSSDGESQDD